jgi:hypothetical protein
MDSIPTAETGTLLLLPGERTRIFSSRSETMGEASPREEFSERV